MAEVGQAVFEIIACEGDVDIGAIRMDSTLTGLGIESLDAVQIVFEIEHRFGIVMSNGNPLEDIDSVAALVARVERLLADSSAHAPRPD